MVLQGGEQQQARESTVAGMPFQYFLGNRGKRLSIAAGLAKVFRHPGVPGRTAVTLDHRPVEFFLRREMPEDNRLVHPRAMGDLTRSCSLKTLSGKKLGGDTQNLLTAVSG